MQSSYWLTRSSCFMQINNKHFFSKCEWLWIVSVFMFIENEKGKMCKWERPKLPTLLCNLHRPSLLLCVSVSGVFHKQIGTLKQTQLMVKGIKDMTESWAGLSGDMSGSVCTWHHLWPFENASRQRLWDCECGVWRLCCFEAIWQKSVIPTIITVTFSES